MGCDNRRIQKIGAALLILSGVSGCQYTPTPDDPRFAPIIPDIAAAPEPIGGSLFSEGAGLSLYHDAKAHRVGDILTVKLMESTQATKNAKSNLKKEYSNEAKNPTILGQSPIFNINRLPFIRSKNDRSLALDIEGKTEFKGSGDSNQNNSLTGDITVTVAQVLPNENLLIRGEKWVTLNQGSEFIRLSGIVRPQDIGPNNEVLSTRIADARITYSGTGDFANSTKQGLLAKFFNSPYWLY